MSKEIQRQRASLRERKTKVWLRMGVVVLGGIAVAGWATLMVS